ncbi:MAG: FAD-binding protein [Candidatus Omnitrophica bacterium]|nr:FAD-binding protein [Candidatus Omnitrophota bacterium]
MVYELIIIGAGPAGITAAVYSARKRLNFLIISKDIGGQTALSGAIENYTGYQFITGTELTQKFEEHIKQFGVQLKEGEEVTDIKRLGVDALEVITDKEKYETRAIIIASGKKPRLLNVPGELEFKNKGVTYCATCDGPLFSGMDVAVIGGGNSALDATLQLIKIANKIYLININPEIKGDAIMREKAEKASNVTILNSAKTTRILGNKFVEALEVEVAGQKKTLNVRGVFIEIGSIPSCDFTKIVAKIRRDYSR